MRAAPHFVHTQPSFVRGIRPAQAARLTVSRHPRLETKKMIPSGFDYHAPRSVADAIALLGQYGGDAKLLAGGHSLLPMMKLRFAQPAHLIDLNRIESMRGIREEGDTIVIGAMTVERDLVNSTLLQQKVPLLPMAAQHIADPQVRNRGTIGGSVANNDPAADYPAALLDTFMAVTMTATLTTYSLFATSPEALAQHGERLLYTVPVVIFGMLRYAYQVHRGRGEDVARDLLRDPWIVAAGVLWLLIFSSRWL